MVCVLNDKSSHSFVLSILVVLFNNTQASYTIFSSSKNEPKIDCFSSHPAINLVSGKGNYTFNFDSLPTNLLGLG